MIIRRNLTARDYVIVKYLCEVEGAKPTDLDDELEEYEPSCLLKVERRYINVPADKVDVVQKYLNSLSGGMSYRSVLEGMRKKGE